MPLQILGQRSGPPERPTPDAEEPRAAAVRETATASLELTEMLRERVAVHQPFTPVRDVRNLGGLLGEIHRIEWSSVG